MHAIFCGFGATCTNIGFRWTGVGHQWWLQVLLLRVQIRKVMPSIISIYCFRIRLFDIIMNWTLEYWLLSHLKWTNRWYFSQVPGLRRVWVLRWCTLLNHHRHNCQACNFLWRETSHSWRHYTEKIPVLPWLTVSKNWDNSKINFNPLFPIPEVVEHCFACCFKKSIST